MKFIVEFYLNNYGTSLESVSSNAIYIYSSLLSNRFHPILKLFLVLYN